MMSIGKNCIQLNLEALDKPGENILTLPSNAALPDNLERFQRGCSCLYLYLCSILFNKDFKRRFIDFRFYLTRKTVNDLELI